jgi:hypothetical protein
MDKARIIRKLEESSCPIKDELIEAVKNLPPGHALIIGNNGHPHYLRCYPMPPKDVFGDPTTGDLFTEEP